MICYLLFDVAPVHGQTLNAVLFERVANNWRLFGLHVGVPIVTFTLLTEGALLFVAAQTGFIDGPRVLASMAVDRWLPRRFSQLSSRLVTQDGVLAMGLAAIAILVFTHARVDLLVVLYAINVFVTFTFSQLGMSVHWWQERAREPNWRRKLAINGVGCSFTALILMLTVTLKFDEGGWVTIVITGALVAVCYMVRHHYRYIGHAIEQLEADILPELFAAKESPPEKYDPTAPTAVLLVNGFNGLGLATLLTLRRLFRDQYRNVIFVGVGEVESSRMKGPEEVKQLEQQVADDLSEYCRFGADLGLHSELRVSIGPDVVFELRKLCLEVAHEFPQAVFFAGKLIFEAELEGFISRFLHNHTALELQNWLQVHGLSLVILPVRVLPAASASRSETGMSPAAGGLARERERCGRRCGARGCEARAPLATATLSHQRAFARRLIDGFRSVPTRARRLQGPRFHPVRRRADRDAADGHDGRRGNQGRTRARRRPRAPHPLRARQPQRLLRPAQPGQDEPLPRRAPSRGRRDPARPGQAGRRPGRELRARRDRAARLRLSRSEQAQSAYRDVLGVDFRPDRAARGRPRLRP